MPKLLFFFAFFENVPFVTLTLTFIFITCLRFGINKRYFFLFNHISFFLTIFSYTLQKLFKLVKNPFFLHFESRHFMTLTLTFTYQFLQPV